jgi:hypothetical protein
MSGSLQTVVIESAVMMLFAAAAVAGVAAAGLAWLIKREPEPNAARH